MAMPSRCSDGTNCITMLSVTTRTATRSTSGTSRPSGRAGAVRTLAAIVAMTADTKPVPPAHSGARLETADVSAMQLQALNNIRASFATGRSGTRGRSSAGDQHGRLRSSQQAPGGTAALQCDGASADDGVSPTNQGAPTMSLTVRRVITGHDQNGHAKVLIDEVAKNVHQGRPGAHAANIWI